MLLDTEVDFIAGTLLVNLQSKLFLCSEFELIKFLSLPFSGDVVPIRYGDEYSSIVLIDLLYLCIWFLEPNDDFWMCRDDATRLSLG